MKLEASDARLLDRVGVLVESRLVRTLLVALIILSVLPFHELEETFRPVFVVCFGLELLVRVPLLLMRRRRRSVGLGQVSFLLIDLAAFVSFLPLELWFGRHFEWLVFMRLSRLLVLLRFARELAYDLYSILTRREQLQQFGLVTVAVAALAFVSAVVLSQLGVRHDYDIDPATDSAAQADPVAFWDQMWWAFRQLESADNLVTNIHSNPVITVLSLILTVLGVFIISFIIGIGTNVVEQVVRAERRRAVGYQGHTIVIGPVAKSEVLVREFARIYMKNRRDPRDQLQKLWRWFVRGGEAPRAWRLPRIALLGPGSTAPPFLLGEGMRWVLYRQGTGSDAESLRRIGASRAKRAILLGDHSQGRDADAVTVATLAALREMNTHAHVYCELLSSRNYWTLHTLGEGSRTFPVDVPWLLGLFILNHLVIPGVERLYRLLLTAEGSELYSHVYLDEAEREAIVSLADEEGMVSAEILSDIAEVHGVVLVGLLMGDSELVAGKHDLIPLDGLVPWTNPYAAPYSAKVLDWGGRAGAVPAGRIRGIIGLGETYQPVRSYARALAQSPSWSPVSPRQLGVELGQPLAPPRRVLAIGAGEALVSLTRRLAELTMEAEVTVAVEAETPALRRLSSALHAGGIPLDEQGGARGELPRGGRLEMRTHPTEPMEAAVEFLSQGAEVDAIILLAEEADDPDARSTLRLMRLAEHFLTSDQPTAPHILMEISSLARGERARLEVLRAFVRAKREAPRLTLVSTEQLRNYFMVHSAFVPGITEVYGQLLGDRGQDLIRLPVNGTGDVTFGDVRRTLANRSMVALGFELADGRVALNPPSGTVFADVRGVFAIGEP